MTKYRWPEDRAAHDAACAAFYGEGYGLGIDPCAVSKTWMRKLYGCALAVLLCVLAVSCGQAKADTRVGAHLGSYHFEGDYNNFNPGVYLYHDGWTAGTYYNSERNQSYYAGYTWEYDLGYGVKAGLTVGAITGYAKATVMPLAVPSVSVDTPLRGTALRISFVPKVEKGGSAAVHFSMEYRFQ